MTTRLIIHGLMMGLFGGLLSACGGSSDVGGAPAEADRTTKLLAMTTTCYPAWDSKTAYIGGGTTSSNGVNYKANWWTQGEDPSTHNGGAGSGQPWTRVSTCGMASSDTVSSATTSPISTSTSMTVSVSTTMSTPSSMSCQEWTKGATYMGGEVVAYLGASFTALVAHTAHAGTWNPKDAPSLWSPGGTCGSTAITHTATQSTTTAATSSASTTVSSTATTPASATTVLPSSGAPEPSSLAMAKSADQTKRVFVGYYPSWSDNGFSAWDESGNLLSDDALLAASKLARVPAYTHVIVAFAQPDFSYRAGAATWTGTGLNFNASPRDIKAAIALLHKRNIKVLLAVGGATYNNWGPLADEGAAGDGPITRALTAVMTDIGFDGLDVDFEVEGNTSANNAMYANAVRAMHNAVDAVGGNKLLSLAGWSTGADCVGNGLMDVACDGRTSYWSGSAGRERAVFSDITLASKIDMVNVMSYDARYEHYDGVKAYQLYRNLFPSKTIVSAGLETAPEGWAGGMLVVNSADAQCAGSVIFQDQFGNQVNKPYSVERYANRASVVTNNRNARDGIMLWHVLKVADARCGNAVVASPGTIGAEVSRLYGLPNDFDRAAWK